MPEASSRGGASRMALGANVESLHVLCDGIPVGRLAETPDGLLAFQYDGAWSEEGYSISPFSLPVERRVFVAKLLPFDGIFGIFDDSLPDGWGRLLVDRVIKSRGVDPAAVGPLTRLAIVGSSGMGALEYVPEIDLAVRIASGSLDDIAAECATLLKTDYSDDLDTLFALGGSSGGARPKILTTVQDEEWIIKFPSSYDAENIGEEEYQIALAAKNCGIEMPEVRLFPSRRCAGYFGVKRFDRAIDNGGRHRKTHMASVGALLEASHRLPCLDYDLLMKLTLRLTDDHEECMRLYRLMCFNAFIGNKDDHAKNFSFLHDVCQDRWTLSPAYDLTHSSGMNGEHATAINGKGKNIGVDDLVAVGARAGISQRRAHTVANEIEECVRQRGLMR